MALSPGPTGTPSVPLPKSQTTNPYPAGQCTWGCWQYCYDNFQVAMPDLSGNAENWADDAKQKGWTVTQTPYVNQVVCWGSSKYPPDGHVAWITKVDLGGSQTRAATVAPGTSTSSATITVYEANFDKRAPYPPGPNQDGYQYVDTRSFVEGSSDADGIQGYITIPGITQGVVASSDPSSGNDPWSGLTQALEAALGPVEQAAQKDVEEAAKLAFAAAQVAGGVTVLAGGGVLLGFAMATGKSPAPQVRAGIAAIGRRNARLQARGRMLARQEQSQYGSTAAEDAANQELLEGGRRYRNVSARELGARNRPETAPPERGADGQVVERGRDFMFGEESKVAQSVRSKIARGAVATMTPGETRWMTENPGEVEAAFARAKVSSRVTRAGRARILVTR